MSFALNGNAGPALGPSPPPLTRQPECARARRVCVCVRACVRHRAPPPVYPVTGPGRGQARPSPARHPADFDHCSKQGTRQTLTIGQKAESQSESLTPAEPGSGRPRARASVPARLLPGRRQCPSRTRSGAPPPVRWRRRGPGLPWAEGPGPRPPAGAKPGPGPVRPGLRRPAPLPPPVECPPPPSVCVRCGWVGVG